MVLEEKMLLDVHKVILKFTVVFLLNLLRFLSESTWILCRFYDGMMGVML